MHAKATARRGAATVAPFNTIKIMWKEGYDYPSDDDQHEDDFFERADHDYEQLNDK